MATHQFKVRSTAPSHLIIPFIRSDTRSSGCKHLQKNLQKFGQATLSVREHFVGNLGFFDFMKRGNN